MVSYAHAPTTSTRPARRRLCARSIIYGRPVLRSYAYARMNYRARAASAAFKLPTHGCRASEVAVISLLLKQVVCVSSCVLRSCWLCRRNARRSCLQLSHRMWRRASVRIYTAPFYSKRNKMASAAKALMLHEGKGQSKGACVGGEGRPGYC